MKVSIIIPAYNSSRFIASAIDSVFSQTYKNIECVIVDGLSNDNTLDILKEYKEKYKEKIVFISEKDKGVFDALNKGIKISTGDVIGWMGDDDFYFSDTVVEDAINELLEEHVEMCWGDLLYVDRENTEKVSRYWKSSNYKKGMFQKGWQLPHFASFVKKRNFEKYGYFSLDYYIAADYDFFLRLLEKENINSVYVSKIFLKMRAGGQSNKSLYNIYKGNKECFLALKKNNIQFSYLKVVFYKFFYKFKQFFVK